MKKSVLLAVAAVVFVTAPALAATKTYQVTGPVTDIGSDTITVQKGSEKWEIAKGSAGVPADVKVGSKVTVQYSMTAESVVSKPASVKASKPSASAAPAAAPVASAPPALSTGAGTPTANK